MNSDSVVRGKINPLIEQWQRICILAERIIRRREAAAVRTSALRRTYLPAHFAFSPLYSSSPSLTRSSSPSSMLSRSSTLVTGNTASGFDSLVDQGDLSRLTNTLRAVIETNEHPWRGDDCELSHGVRHGLEEVATYTQKFSDLADQRVRVSIFLSASRAYSRYFEDADFARHHPGGSEGTYSAFVTVCAI